MKIGWVKTAILLMVVVFMVAGCSNKWVTSGKIAMNGKRFDKAISDFNMALKENPENGEAHFYIASCYLEKEEYKKMLTHVEAAERLYLKGAIKLKEFRVEAWRKLFDAGRENADARKWEASRDEFELAIQITPERYEAYTNAGFVWQHLDNNDSAFFYYTKAHEIAPDEITVLENYASLCFNIDKFDIAEGLYQKILIADPKNAPAKARLGDIFGQKKEFQTAVDYYNQALELESDNCNLWFNLGILYFRELKDNDNAIRAFSRSADLCPEDANGHINLCVAYIEAGKLDEAQNILETFTEDFPGECAGWDLYFKVLMKKGLRKQAQEAFKKYEECSGN